MTFSFVVVQITQCAINYTRFDGNRGKISPRNFKFVDAKYTLCEFGTRKTPTRMIPLEQFPPGNAPPRITPTWKIPTWKTPIQDNSHLENSHLENTHPENFTRIIAIQKIPSNIVPTQTIFNPVNSCSSCLP